MRKELEEEGISITEAEVAHISLVVASETPVESVDNRCSLGLVHKRT